MICKIIQDIGLFIFWKCLDDESREKSISEHRYTKMNNNHIGSIVKKVEIYEEKYMYIRDKVISVSDLIENNNNLGEVKAYIRELAKEVENV